VGQEAGERVGPHQRDVDREKDDVGLLITQGTGRAQKGVPRPELWLLESVGDPVADMFPHFPGPMTNHNDEPLGLESPSGFYHVIDHGPAENRMQSLGQVRLHPRSLPGGEDDNLQRPARQDGLPSTTRRPLGYSVQPGQTLPYA
jgi:hypothetical protein